MSYSIGNRANSYSIGNKLNSYTITIDITSLTIVAKKRGIGFSVIETSFVVG